MKHLSKFVLLIMLTVVFSCNEKIEEKEDSGSKGGNRKEMMEINRKVLTAIETGDSATIRQYIADDAVDHGGGENGTDLKGEEIVNMLASVHKKIENLKFEVLQEAANDDHLFCLTRMTGTVKEAVWGMPAGMKADMKSVDVIKVKDNNKMTDHWVFIDPAEMMKMMDGGKPDARAAKDSAR